MKQISYLVLKDAGLSIVLFFLLSFSYVNKTVAC